MSKPYKLDADVMSQFTPELNSKNMWVVKLAPNRYLHWIESLDNSPVTSSRPDITMAQYNFVEEAEAVINYLRHLWSKDITMLDKYKSMSIVVDLDRNKKLKAGGE